MSFSPGLRGMKSMTERMQKWSCRLLKTTACAVGIHALLGPDIFLGPEFNSAATYGPNPVQQEFLRLLAESHDYVGLADTDHISTQISIFSTHTDTTAALARGGVKNVFIESGPKHQSTLDALRKDPKADQYNEASMWVCNKEHGKAINRAFNDSLIANAGQVHFVAADQRHAKGDVFGAMNPVENALFRTTLSAYETVYGCMGAGAFVLANITSGLALSRKIEGILFDDRPTADYIATFNGKGVIRFGANHFKDIGPGGTSLRSLLQEKNKTIVIAEVYENAATGIGKWIDDTLAEADQKTQSAVHQKKLPKKADVIFYINTTPSNPDGVDVVNPAYRPLYEQAKKAASKPSGPGGMSVM